jgi:hypothetical protein
MKDHKKKATDDMKEILEYQKPVLVNLNEKDKYQLGMCGVGVTGVPIICTLGSGALSCGGGAAGGS